MGPEVVICNYCGTYVPRPSAGPIELVCCPACGGRLPRVDLSRAADRIDQPVNHFTGNGAHGPESVVSEDRSDHSEQRSHAPRSAPHRRSVTARLALLVVAAVCGGAGAFVAYQTTSAARTARPESVSGPTVGQGLRATAESREAAGPPSDRPASAESIGRSDPVSDDRALPSREVSRAAHVASAPGGPLELERPAPDPRTEGRSSVELVLPSTRSDDRPGQIAPPLRDRARRADGEPRRIRVRTPAGRMVIARVQGDAGDHVSVLLPDGQIGFPKTLAYTDDPFRPVTVEEAARELSGGEFSGFQVLTSAHYVVLYQSTPSFASASLRLLEDLYKGLSEAFRKRGFPVHDAEFPLVAVIYKTERDFRTHRKVEPEVQAFYEIFTNRIFLYQSSERDERAPEVAAFRKPQTVAHEGTHQILQNIGIQARLSPWPIWLIEGLAEYCSTPLAQDRGDRLVANWKGIGRVNSLHMATIRDIEDPPVKLSSSKHVRVGRDPLKPLAEYLVTRTELTPTDYALAWALTHYLAQRREADFMAYVRSMSRLAPLSRRSPQDQLAAFQSVFGDDLEKLDKTVSTYLSKIKHDALPYYFVMFQQPLGMDRYKRATIVSQSPSTIQQWLQTVTSPQGGPPVYQAFSYPTKSRALFAAQQWIGSR